MIILVALFTILVVLLQWPAVHHSAMQQMKLVHTDDGWGIPMDYDHICCLFPYKFTMYGLRVVDPTGRGFSAGEAEVYISLWSLATSMSEVTVDSVTVRNSVGTDGDGYVEDNTKINAVEQSATQDWADRNSRDKTWPNLPRGLIIKQLVIKALYIPVLNRTIHAEGSLSFKSSGGNFLLKFAVSDDRSNNLDFSLAGTQLSRRVQVQASIANTSEPCRIRPDACERLVSVQSVFPTQRTKFTVGGALDLSVDVAGTYGGLLQAAFPSKNFQSASDLLAGTLSVRLLAPQALVSSVVTVVRISGNRTLIVDEARIATPLLLATSQGAAAAPLVLSVAVLVPAKGLPSLLRFNVPEQRVNLPLPLGEADVAFHLVGAPNSTAYSGWALVRKYDSSTGSEQQWTLNGTYAVTTLDVAAQAFAVDFRSVELDVALGHMRGRGIASYSPAVGANVNVALTDPLKQLSIRVNLSPYRSGGDHRAHQLGIEMIEPVAQLRKLNIENLHLTARVFDIPDSPYGNMDIGFGQVNYDNGVFIMNNASVVAARAPGALDSTPWELTASSDTDLRTRFTLMLVGNGENEFRGSVAPFDAVLYGSHRIWTSEQTRLSFNYQQQEFSLSCALHANEAEPERVSLDVNVDKEKIRLIVNDASYLLDPLLLKPRLRTSGLLQGYIEMLNPLTAPQLGALDMCWNDGAAFDASGVQVAHNVHGCVRGNYETGWKINNPPALFVLDSPRLGQCELRANISAARRQSATGDVLDLPVQAALRMLDPDASALLESGWIALEAQLSMKL